MKEWKNIKDKEVIIGLIIIIILGVIALFLLVRREIGYQRKEPVAAEDNHVETEILKEEMFPVEEADTELLDSAEVLEEPVEAEQETKEKNENVLANVQIVNTENSKETANKKVSLYDVLGEEKYVASTLTERKQEDTQLKEIYEYWDAYKLDAVADLIRLERVQKISQELEGKNQFYYYGSVDRLGRPSGKGLAVYGNNTYYFGEWKEGLRHGKGMWLEVAIYTEDNKEKNLGVIEHSYNGQWSKDLPNGAGQEHFSYDYSLLKEDTIEGNMYVANVIGDFKDGYYHGEMYVMTVDEEGSSTDWSGTCKEGIWNPIIKGNTTDAVWECNEKEEDGNSEFYYLHPNNNKNHGIIGLKK